jgi:hypothetical protein
VLRGLAIVLVTLLAWSAEAQCPRASGAKSEAEAGSEPESGAEPEPDRESESESEPESESAPLPLPPPARREGDALAESASASQPESPSVTELDVVNGSARSLLGAHGAFFAELGLTRGRWPAARVIAFSPELGFRYRVDDWLTVEASWGVTFGGTRNVGEATIEGETVPFTEDVDRVEPANPTIGGLIVHRDRAFLLETGLAVSVATAARADASGNVESIAERAGSGVTHRAAMAMRGYRGAYRWAPERFSVSLPFRLAIPLAPVVLEIDAALAAMFPVLGDRGVDVDVLVELGAGASVHVAGPFYVGARVGGVGAALGVTARPFTLSVEPWLRLRIETSELTMRAVMNVAGEDAIGGGAGPVFGFFVGTGTAF